MFERIRVVISNDMGVSLFAKPKHLLRKVDGYMVSPRGCFVINASVLP